MNIYLYPADGVDVKSVEYLEEARRILKLVDECDGNYNDNPPLVFNDSRKINAPDAE